MSELANAFLDGKFDTSFLFLIFLDRIVNDVIQTVG